MTFRRLKDDIIGKPEPAPLIASGNPMVLAEAKERKKGGKVKRTGKSIAAMEGKRVKLRADRPERRAAGGQLLQAAPAPGVGGVPWGLALGGTTKRRRSESIREGDSIRPRATMED